MKGSVLNREVLPFLVALVALAAFGLIGVMLALAVTLEHKESAKHPKPAK